MFFKKPKKELPPLITDEELDGASYEQVLDFMANLSDSDYHKVNKVVAIYRKANAEVAKLTGMEATDQRSIFDHEEMPPVPAETDTELGDFLDEPAYKRKGKKVPSKNANSKKR